MADTTDMEERESNDDDSISLTSTIVSNGDGLEYDVDCILAEWERDGVMSYLTKWDGYPIDASTWQLRESFGPEEVAGHDVFKEWDQKKMRVHEGCEEAFDIESFERRQTKLMQESYDRKARRKQKRAKLNQMVSVTSSNADEKTEEDSKSSRQIIKAPSPSESTFQWKDSHLATSLDCGTKPPEKTFWTGVQQQTFLKAVQDANGPYWNDILSRYGHHGTVNQVLRDKTIDEMQKQLRMLRQEFVKAGKDPPAYTDATKPRKKGQTFNKLESRDKCEARALSEETDDHNDKRTSTDFKTEKVKAIQASQLLDGNSISSSFNKEQMIETPILKEFSHAPAKGTYAEGSKERECSDAKKPYAGTARPSTSRPKEGHRVSKPARSSSSILSPSRFGATSSQGRSDRRAPKAKASGVDIMANWSGKPSIKRAKTLPTTNKAVTTNNPLKTFKTLRIRNNVHKWRSNEPAPDPAQLVFLDPKTGKAPKMSPTSVADGGTASFRQAQEELTAREIQTCSSEEQNNIAVDHDEGPDADGDYGIDKAPVDEAASTNSCRLNNQGEDNYNKQLISPNLISESDCQASSRPAEHCRFPVNAPTGPRALSERSLQPQVRRSYSDLSPPPIPLDIAETAYSHPQTSFISGLNTLVLHGDPTHQEKHDLFNSFEKNHVIGSFKIGPQLEDFGKMKLAGFDRHVRELLLAIKDRDNPRRVSFEFSRVCTITDCGNHWLNYSTINIGSGYVVPNPENQERYESLVELLACNMALGICPTKEFTMLIWPAHSSIWGFLENYLPKVPPGTVLRFALRKKISSELVNHLESPMISHLRQEDAKYYDKIKNTIHDRSIEPGEKHINVVFREVFGIEFGRLIASNSSQGQPLSKNFFLCFVPANCEQYEPDENKRQALCQDISEEHDLFIQFLQANGADMIGSMQDMGSYEAVQNGSWRYFIENIKSGVVIIHEKCGRPDQLPHLGKFLSSRGGGINVWVISLSSVDPVDESHPHLVRCFPHGGVILLTISLMLYHPYETLRILRWFRLEVLPSKPSGTWKIAVRPRIQEWLLDLHDLCHKETWRSPFGDVTLQVYADINIEVMLLLDRDVEPWGLAVEVWDNEVPLSEAPIVAGIHLPRARREWVGDSFETAKIDHDAVCWNDNELIQWFSEWAGDHMHDHRKFQVVLGYLRGDPTGDRLRKCYEKGYTYINDGPIAQDCRDLNLWERNFLEILSYDQCFARHNMSDQVTLNAKDAARRQKERDLASRLHEEAEAERKEERLVAKSALETIMQVCKDEGGTEEQVRAAGRRHLLWLRDEEGIASNKEVEDCAIDMNWKPPNGYRWMSQIINGSEEEREATIIEQRKEEERRADRETLSGTQERRQMWEHEIQMWAEQDRESGNPTRQRPLTAT